MVNIHQISCHRAYCTVLFHIVVVVYFFILHRIEYGTLRGWAPPWKVPEAIDDSQTESEKLELKLFKDFSFLEQHESNKTTRRPAVIIRPAEQFDFFQREQKKTQNQRPNRLPVANR